jgi:hypothetical protein
VTTKTEAAEKVAKLRRLAAHAGTGKEEAQSAKVRASELISKWGLTESDLALGAKANAFDDLMTALDAYVKKHDVPIPVFHVIDKIKRETSKEDKAAALDKIKSSVEVISMFFGFDKTVAGVRKTIDEVVTRHELKL